MANLQLSLAVTNNPRTWPIIDGRAKADGIDFTMSVVDPSEMFWRQLHYAEFDVSEMSMSSLMMITAQGDKRFYALAGLHDALFLPHEDSGAQGR